MRKLAIINYKGGTGKTSTVVNMAHGLALKGKRVLVVDTDPQGSAGYYLGVESELTIYDVVMGLRPASECIVSARPNLDIICANERLFPAEMRLANEPGREHVLSRRLAGLQGYDFVLVDCAPSMNLMNQNSLIFSDELLLPVSMEYLSLVGIKQLLKNIDIVNKLLGKEIRICKIVPTFYDKRNRKTAHIMDSLERVFPGRLASPIRVSVGLSEAPGYRQTIFEFSPRSNAADDYRRLINEVISNG
jgi:chromosome partitioning protein